MRPAVEIRTAARADYPAINRVSTAAWSQYAAHFADWARLAAFLANVTSIGSECELVVAEKAGAVVGVVGYTPPNHPREAIFPGDWAVIRMLSVHPSVRDCGIGTALARSCIEHAVRDRATKIGLHTSAVMDAALRLYQRLGFTFERAIPNRHGALYAVFALDLGGRMPPARRLGRDG